MKTRLALIFALSSSCAVVGLGQTVGGIGAAGPAMRQTVTTTNQSARTGRFTMSAQRVNSPAVVGGPYSAEQVFERVQTLLDGTHITQAGPSTRMYRDSVGRTRTERPMGMSLQANAPRAPVMIEIRDPQAGVAYVLDTQGRVAHRITLQPMPNRPAGAPISIQAQRPAARCSAPQPVSTTTVTKDGIEHKMESLGNQMVEGILAEGRRTTTTYPVGYQGADRPIAVVSEMWTAPDLGGMVMLSKTDDPRNGVSTQKLINFSRNEPDPTLFMPPLDYSIVEETGPSVTIEYTLP